MDKAHLHLMITHLPIFGMLCGAIVMAFALYSKSRTTTIAAYYVVVLAAVGGLIAYFTGEAAEHNLKKFAEVSGRVIHEHEEFAELTVIAVGVTGAVALIGLLLTYKTSRHWRVVASVGLLLTVVSLAMASYTGYLGGKIRHTEIYGAENTTVRAAAGNDDSGPERHEDHDD